MKILYCNENGKIYFSPSDCCKELNIDNGNLHYHLNGKKYRHLKGYTFRYLTEEEIDELRNYWRNKPNYLNR